MPLNLNQIARNPTLVRLGIFVGILLLFWLPIAVPIYLVLGSDRNLTTILTMGWLFIAFLLLVRLWGQWVYRQPRLLQQYGLRGSWQNFTEGLQGLGIGLFLTFGLFLVQRMLGWLEFQNLSVALVRIIGEGLLSAIAVGFAEELVFRGWFLDELQRDYSPQTTLWVNAFVFALAHFLKPLVEIIRTFPQFLGLLLLGLTFVWAKRSQQGRLGLAIGLHAGLVWGYYIVNVGQLIQYREQISPWLTGINNNPLASLTGVIFLLGLALWMQARSRSPKF